MFVLTGAARSGLSEKALTVPAYEQFTEDDATKFDKSARSTLAPVYPYLAEYLADRFDLRDKKGIGIDIGGGSGDLVIELCKRTSNFFWINADINTFFAEHVSRRADKEKCTHRVGMVFADAQYLPFRDGYADIIVSRGSLQFWGDRKQAFADIYRVLKPGGSAFVGRGFPPNLPLEVARGVRKQQGKGMPSYKPEELAEELKTIMADLKITDYELLRPRMDQNEIGYGVWVVFSKPEDVTMKELETIETGQHPQTIETEATVNVRMDYLLYLPPEYNESEKPWPLLLFLHGAGERGDDLERVKLHGPTKRIATEKKHFPFVIVSPQCPETAWWTGEVQLIALDALLNGVVSRYRIDRDRIYVTGLSMGGYGTWALACAQPNRFAAIAPICGQGDPSKAATISHLPAWVFHGAKDTVVPFEHSEAMVQALQDAGADVKFTVYPEAGHDSWTETYNNPELYDWFLKHKRSKM